MPKHTDLMLCLLFAIVVVWSLSTSDSDQTTKLYNLMMQTLEQLYERALPE